MYSQHRIGVVIPAYNEETLIQDTLRSIPRYVDRIYIIDDGSTDRTPERIREMDVDPRYVTFSHKENHGVGAAITTGYKRALKEGIDIVAVMAGDNQMDPKYLPYLLDPIVWKIADYTKGNRLLKPESRNGMPPFRSFGNSLLTYVTKMSSGYYEMIDPQNGYTAISRRALQRIDIDSVYQGYGYCNDLLAKLNVAGCRILDVVIPARYGKERSKIKYSIYIFKVSWLLLKTFLWRLYMKYFVIEFHPIILFYVCGFILALLGLVGGAYSVYNKLFQQGQFFVNGMLSLILFMIGLQFVLFGIIFDIQKKDRMTANEILSRLK
jgi:glycosyltransferase involved in cell wall biosynthesis